MNATHIKPYSAIIFDLGGVILNLSIQKTIESFREKIANFDDSDFCGKPNQGELFSRYEIGAIGTQTFYLDFLKHCRTDLSFESFVNSWNEMLLDLPKVRIELLDSLRKRGTRVFLLSNINELHAKQMDVIYQGLSLGGSFREHFERAYYSFEMGLRKPDPEIFRRVIAENGLVATDTLFIDDSAQHIESARTLGLQTIHLFNGETIDKLSL